MSLARSDAGDIHELYSTASGGLNRNHRDAASGTGRTQPPWKNSPTPIHMPGKGYSSPFSRRMTSGDARKVESREGRAGSSSAGALRSSPRRGPKRQRLDHLEEREMPITRSKHFYTNEATRHRPAQIAPSASTSSRHSLATADAIVIEDDTPVTKDDDARKPIELPTSSSPDPMDIITPEVSYAFDQNKPSPIHEFSSSLEGRHRVPRDGASTLRLRKFMQDGGRMLESASRMDGDGDGAQPRELLPSTSGSTARAGMSSVGSNVRSKVAHYETMPRQLDLRTMGKIPKKSAMKPKPQQRDVAPLPIHRLDIDATRPSGFAPGPKSLKGKVIGNNVPVYLPLTEWSIGVSVSPREVETEPLANLVLESGFLKVRDASGSTQFELQLKKDSVVDVKYVDVQKTPTSAPLIQIHPSVMATVHNHASFKFQPGHPGPEGLLTFRFDKSARDWDGDVYMAVVQNLVSALDKQVRKSTLDAPAVKAVWEAVIRDHESPSVSTDPTPMLFDIPKENPPNPPSNPRSRLRPAGTTIDFPVRRSARLSVGEQKRHSPMPDPDELILYYRFSTGSMNITNGDVSRLKPGEFLNDTLIEFGLKLWLADLQASNPELASQVHVFSSFFYKKLSTKIPKEGYNSVRKWTSRFDLFQKKYIIVPINENLHWYLAIIYLPEHTLVRPVQETKSNFVRRSTRRLRVIIDSSDPLQPDPAPKLSLPPDPDPPPNGQLHIGPCSGSVDPETPKTDDRRDEIDVELMVESDLAQVDSTTKLVGAASPDTLCPESPTLVYPHSSPPSHPVTLPTSDPQGDGAEQVNRLASSGEIEGDTIRTSGIPPSNFYGTKNQGRRDSTPQLAPINNSAPPDIEIDEDETMGNPESGAEESTEHPRTYIYTFDSLASKHPQAVKRLSKYLLMEAHDKKQRDESTLNEPKGMQAIVPDQPNYCDCGIYLLHFARTFMKDPKLSSDIIRRPSPQKGRRVPHEHWDGASAGNYRDELARRIKSMSEEWKRQRGEHDPGTKNETDAGGSGSGAGAPQEQLQQLQPQQQQQDQQQQPRGGDPTPATSSKADNDSDSDIEVLCSPQKPPPSKAPRKDSGLSGSLGKAVRLR